MDDPILPVQRGKTRKNSGSGGPEHSISNELAVPFTDTGSPGMLSQIRGLGKRTEETDVQAYGIPLNGPQGGGFDFSTFPQFIWDDFRYQIGPSLGAFDPAGVAGSLTLVPWTSAALNSGPNEYGARGTFLYSNRDLRQFSVAGKKKDELAAVLGYSTGALEGLSGALSTQYRWQRHGKHRARFHFLGTDVFGAARTVRSGQQDPKYSTRLIPVLQTDFELSSDTVLKNTFFYDWSVIRSEATGGNYTRAFTRQVGAENVLVSGDWKLGLSARNVTWDRVYMYPSLGLAKDEHVIRNIVNLNAARAFQLGGVLIEPSARATLVTRYDLLPEGSLGARYEYAGRENAVFSRLSYTRKFPTLVTLYYTFPPLFGFPGHVGNPGLKPEKNVTWIVGHEGATEDRKLQSTLQLFAQKRYDGEVLASYDASYDWYVNAESATILAAMATGTYRPTAWLDLREALTISHSRIDSTGLEYPSLPRLINLFSAIVHEPGDEPRWDAALTARFAGESAAAFTSNRRLPAYAFFDLNARAEIFRAGARAISVTGGIENLFNREIETAPFNFSVGRIYTVGLAGQL
jgi:hypothetical protein